MSTALVIAAVGSKALWLLYLWLASAAISAVLSRSKGYGEKPGLGTGLLLSAVGVVIWLAIPPRDETAEWHHRKPWQRRPKAADVLGLSGEDLAVQGTAVQRQGETTPPAG